MFAISKLIISITVHVHMYVSLAYTYQYLVMITILYYFAVHCITIADSVMKLMLRTNVQFYYKKTQTIMVFIIKEYYSREKNC